MTAAVDMSTAGHSGGGVVVVGAGQAGFQTAVSLRERGYGGRITLVGDEDAAPYERPPLSKAYLTGEADEALLWLRPPEYYVRQSIDLLADRVTAIDRAACTARLAGGGVLDYDHLVLATGARPRRLAVPGSELRGVWALRTLAEALALRDELRRAAEVVVVGAGFIGLEFAAAARALGCAVTVVELLDRPLARAVGERTAEHFTRLHRRQGTRLLFGRRVARFHDDGSGAVTEVELCDGSRLPTDLVVLGAGVEPRTELAETAGLRVDDGIAVDARLRTGDPAVSAIGDCAAFPYPAAGRRIRLESVQNAVGHAQLVAERLTGLERDYDDLPWFWSDQFSSTLQIAGLSAGHDTEVLLGEWPDAFSVLSFREDRLVAVESVNRPADHMAARRVLANGVPLDPATAAGDGFALRDYARRHRSKPLRPATEPV
ncbi:NAD(P)/FAD-dependent oxidoreductase [Streptomyces sp. NL15-2K]|uniref:NAD(P)/FAD-dependent oxidoreductase n=1 Tax=Streptomyces sp. NL15-2K TaxID=376149 RepID=UPI000FFAD89A|nr:MULTISPECIES: FAD-dependent oxidoreductase [Actinomycetes]WKX13926.1 FAD-dependent oxidoreductase [Kutzneria buriramensis]GCB50887.1 ferredoxin reductase [Streptomyces sp. NL15-2K]